jgi:tetratricopeptide (TPR) repeat protein
MVWKSLGLAMLLSLWMLSWPQASTETPRTQESWAQQARSALQSGDLSVVRSLAEPRLKEPSVTGEAHLLLGLVELQQHNYAVAIEHFRSARSAGLETEELFERWTDGLSKLGRLNEASHLLEEILSLHPSLRDLRYRLAEVYLTEGKSRKALPHLEQAYREGFRNAHVLLQLAAARFTSGLDYKAVELLEPIVHEGSSSNLLLQIGKLYFKNLLYSQAVVAFGYAWDAVKSYECGMYLALAQYQLEHYAECVRILEQVKPESEALEYRILKGSSLARIGKWDEAERELARTVADFPDRADGYLNFGLLWLERGDREKAWALLEKGSRLMLPGTKVLYRLNRLQSCSGLSPGNNREVRNKGKAEFYSNLGETFHKNHHWSTALDLFLLALEEDVTSSAPYGAIGVICQEIGSPEEGKEFLKRGLELHPLAADLHYYLGTIESALGHYQQAIPFFQRALELDGPNPQARHWLFLGVAQMGADPEAQRHAKDSLFRARELQPELALVHFELGKWYLKNQELDLAEQSLQKAIDLDPQLLGAYYQYGIACTRNGKAQKGQEFMAVFQEKKALRQSSSHTSLGEDSTASIP